MNDGARRGPVDILLMHHAVSDFMVNWDDISVQDWFSNVGKARGYQGGAINPMHEHPSRPGQLTYSMAQWNLREYTADGNKYGYRLTELIKRPFENVAWHAGVWDINVRSMGIETSGNFVNGKLPQKALMLVADTFRQHDKNLGGALNILGHRDIVATACPGQIYGQLPELIDMINNPAKWNEILWPNPKKPVPAARKLENETVVIAKNDSVALWDLDTNPNYKSIKTFKKGEVIRVVAAIDFNDTVYYQTEYSFGRNKHGVNRRDVTVEETVYGSREVTVPYETSVTEVTTLPVGERRVVAEGVDGLSTEDFVQKKVDGVVVEENSIKLTPIRLPAMQLVEVGVASTTYPDWFKDFWVKLIEAIKSILTGK